MNKIAVNIGSLFDSPLGKTKGILDVVSIVVEAAFAIAGIIVIFMFIFGGITLIASAGQGNPEGVGKGKKAVTSALIGFIIILTSFWVVRLIEIITGYDFLTSPGLS